MEGGPEGSHRYRFSWEGIDVQIDGTPGMIDQIRRKLGLADVGWVIQRPIEPTTVQPASMARTGPDVPAPDPGRIPVVRRPVGSLDLDAALAKVGLEPPGDRRQENCGRSSINSMGCRSSTAQVARIRWRRHGCGS